MFQIAQNFGPFDFQFDFQFDFHKRKCIDLPQYVTRLQTKAVLIAWLSLSIIIFLWKKNQALEQICMFQIKSCAEQQN